MKYTELTFTELVNKIGSSRFFDLPSMLKEAFTRLANTPSGGYEPPYKVYTALLTQSGTDAPIATVLENTLGGDIVWSRLSEGYYKGTPSQPIFEENKTFHFVNSNNQGDKFEVASQFDDTDVWRITVLDTGIAVDSSLQYLPIEIRVYS